MAVGCDINVLAQRIGDVSGIVLNPNGERASTFTNSGRC